MHRMRYILVVWRIFFSRKEDHDSARSAEFNDEHIACSKIINRGHSISLSTALFWSDSISTYYLFFRNERIYQHICINLNLPLRSPIISRNRELASCSRCNFYFATITIRISIWMSGHVTNVECYQAWEESYEYLTSAEYSHDTFVSIA